MRTAMPILVCVSIALLLPACGKKEDQASGKGEPMAAGPSPEEQKAKAAEASKAAEAPALEAFQKVKTAFQGCDRLRLNSVATMKAAAKRGEQSQLATKMLLESRACLEKWWAGIDEALKAKSIGRDAWMPHFQKWSETAGKLAIPAPKPMEGGKAHVLKGTNKGVGVTFQLPADWKAVKAAQKKAIKVVTEGVELTAKIAFVSKVREVADMLEGVQLQSAHVQSQEYDVGGVKGVLSLTKVDDRWWVEWYGNIQVEPTHKFGDMVSISIEFAKTPELTEGQLQRAIDILGAVKIQDPPRKK